MKDVKRLGTLLATLAVVATAMVSLSPAANASPTPGQITDSTVSAPAAVGASADDVSIQGLRTICAQDIQLRDAPSGTRIGWLHYGDQVWYRYSRSGYDYVYSYKHQTDGWIVSGYLC